MTIRREIRQAASSCVWLACLLLSACVGGAGGSAPAPAKKAWLTGLEVLARDGFASLEGRRVAVVTNPTGVDGQFESVVDLIAAAPAVELVAVFGPEHGVRGAAEAGVHVGDAVDPRTGVPAYSLYGAQRRPSAEQLRSADVVLFDIQDIGVRTYTYVSTLIGVLEVCAELDIEVWILDRPAPLGGRAEGPVLEEDYASFVGPHPVPLRHGLTIGEFARLVMLERGIEMRHRVIPLEGWTHETPFESGRLPWIAPSPNIPDIDTALVYAGTVLVEGVATLSEGRGTTRPFRLIGAPWVDARRLVEGLRRAGLPGVEFREASFTPSFSKFQAELCRGVEIYVRDRETYRPVDTALELLSLLRRHHAESFRFREAAFDRLAGSASLRAALEAGVSRQSIVASWKDELARFRERAAAVRLYE